MARVPQSSCGNGSEHPGSMRVHPGPEDDCASVPHSVCSAGSKGGTLALPIEIPEYQAIMVEQDDVEIVVTNIVSPASFLHGSMGEPVIHDCLDNIEATYSSRLDLKDTPLKDTET